MKTLQRGLVLCKITSGPGIGLGGPFQTGATDGRQTIANFVGINDSFWPYQLEDRNVEVAAVYSGVYIYTKCLELSAGGAYVPMSTTNRDAVAALQYGRTLVFAD